MRVLRKIDKRSGNGKLTDSTGIGAEPSAVKDKVGKLGRALVREELSDMSNLERTDGGGHWEGFRVTSLSTEDLLQTTAKGLSGFLRQKAAGCRPADWGKMNQPTPRARAFANHLGGTAQAIV